ncbi:MAG TPA: tetratricopeptide repeat protein [Methylomirabilota bacterium]|jgi:TolA-binding protein
MRRRRRLAPVLGRVALAGLAVLAIPAPGAAARSEADRLWLVGAGAFEDGLYETAYRELGRFIQAAPSDRRRGDAALLRGKAAFSMEPPRYAEALAEFDAAETFPLTGATPGEAIYWQAEALHRLRRLEEARDRYSRFLALKPASPYVPEALYARGLTELEIGRADGAIDTFRDFLREYPTHAHAPTAAYSAARELIRAKRWDDALALLTPYAKNYPASPYLAETRYLLGVAQHEAGRPEAGRTLEQFIAQAPGSDLVPTARVLAAEEQTKAGKLREALEQYQALVRTAPTHELAPKALYRIGEISLRLNRPTDAEAAWTTLRRDYPQSALAGSAGLATARLHEQRKQWEPALQVAQSVADRKGEERSDALLIVGQSALQLRRNAEAAQAYHTVVVEAPAASKRYFEGLAGLAVALESATDKEGARRAYREIVDTGQDPDLVRWAKGRLAALDAPAPPTREAPRPKPRPKAPGGSGG